MPAEHNVYALLIGVDNYLGPVPTLNGCKNDIAAITDLLSVRVENSGENLHIKQLLDAEATRDNAIAEFRSHLGQAGAGDVALFYYSGHGSQEPAPEEFWDLEPDHLDETLVLHDSRLEGKWDVADKELAALIAEIGQNGPHTVVILDCCHSGSGTRAVMDDAAGIRRAPSDQRLRPLDSFLFAAARAGQLTTPAKDRAAMGDSGWAINAGKHVLIAAARSNETAKEVASNGQIRGAMSAALQAALTESGSSMTYRDLHRQLSAVIRGQVRDQHPQLETSSADDLDRPFLGGAITAVPGRFVVTYQPGTGWIIDGGRMHGITPQVGDESTRLTIVDGSENALASAVASTVGPGESTISVTEQPELDQSKTYGAIVVGSPLPPLLLLISGDATMAAEFRSALGVRDAAGGPLLVREATAGESPAVGVEAFPTGFRMAKVGSERTLAPFAPTTDNALAMLEQIALWRRTELLRNGNTQFTADSVTVTLTPETVEATAEAIAREQAGFEVDGSYRLEYVDEVGGHRARKFTVAVANTGKRPVWFAMLDLTENYGIYADSVPAGSQLLDVGESHPIKLNAEVPDDMWRQGVTETTDLLKFVFSSSQFDPRNLQRDDLEVQAAPRVVAGVRGGAQSTLDRLFERVGTRRARLDNDADEVSDWFTRDLLVTAARPSPGVSVRSAGPAELAPGVRISSHQSFDGKVQVSTAPDATRDLAAPPIPPLLADDLTNSAPFSLLAARGFGPAADALVIQADREQADLVTVDAPLIIQLDSRLEAGEHVLPFAWDGEFYIPLGFSRSINEGTGTEIVLQRLSAPLVTSRSLSGSIRILFRKITSKAFGGTYEYPLLRLAKVEPDGTVAYVKDRADIAAEVATARRVLLYVHGIIGDTEGMARSSTVTGVSPAPPLVGKHYNAILTFDYENLNTTIEENARLLGARLAEVGLDAGHDKQFDIVAHSMGGLVSRQLLEFVGGVKVNKLVTLGTPNAGSPWPSVQKWATAAAAFAVNSLTAVVWPLQALAGVLGAIEKVDNALDEMEPGSPFLTSLATGKDPQLPYKVIIGNRSLIPATSARATGLLSKVVGGAVNLAFLGAPNDLAVATSSARSVPTERTPSPEVYEIACDHVTFFETAAGLEELAKALA